MGFLCLQPTLLGGLRRVKWCRGGRPVFFFPLLTWWLCLLSFGPLARWPRFWPWALPGGFVGCFFCFPFLGSSPCLWPYGGCTDAFSACFCSGRFSGRTRSCGCVGCCIDSLAPCCCCKLSGRPCSCGSCRGGGCSSDLTCLGWCIRLCGRLFLCC